MIRGALAALLLAGAAVAHAAPRASGRVETPLMTGWRFFDGDAGAGAGAGAAAPQFDDRGWQRVTLPHSWNRVGEYALDPGPNSRKRQGIGWYRLTLDGRSLPDRAEQWLQFDAVGNIADVWVNGVHVGRHAGAFSRFRIDVTRALRRDGVNVIAVRADNARPEPGSATQDVIPLLGDFFIHGGLYRPVALVSVARAHIALGDHGGPGVYVRATLPAPDRATVTVTTRLETGDARALRLRTRIEDAAGHSVAQTIGRVTGDVAAPGFTIHAPHRWNGRADPYLYTAVVELLDHGRVVDRVRQPFGIRSFRFDAEQGFFLNGHALALHGVSRHQDVLGKGWALSPEDHARDMALIEEIGANTIRMAHYQHAQDWFDLSDRAGMIVWAELPFVNKLSFGDAPATPALIANARAQMIELIRQNYNHPAVVTWGIGNETDIDLAFGRLGPKADPRSLLDLLRAVVAAEDPDRPTVIADCCEATPGDKVPYLPMLAGHADLMGYNRYFGWYYGRTGDLGPHLDMLHARHPEIPLSVSEYGAGGALSQHSDNPVGGPVNAGGRPHPEEFQSWFHEQSWPQLRARRFVWASWIWNMFDFASTVRHEGDATDINDKGLVSYDRRTRKDAFFYYKAQWREDVPVLHITGRRYVDRAYPVTDVRVYANLPEVELLLNGAPAGRAVCVDHVCVFPQVALRPGDNHLEVRGRWKGAEVRDALDWNAPDAREGLTINVGDLTGYVTADGRRVGSDNWFDGGRAGRVTGRDADRFSGAGDSRARLSHRDGSFRYAIPLPDGRWRVTLLFAASGAVRTFDVTANDAVVLRHVTPSPRIGVERAFDVAVRGGVLRLGFGPEATLSAIGIRPAR